MPLRRALRWTLPPLALVALAGWIASTPLAERAHAEAAPQTSGIVPDQGPAAPPPSAAGPDRLPAVQKFVAQKNEESRAQREALAAQGWSLVQAPPPDMRLTKLDPSLLNGREAELRQQIASTTASREAAKNLAQIAREAHEEATQFAAVDALGRIRTGE